MKFSLRTFLLLAIGISVIVGGYLIVERERRIERDLVARVNRFPMHGYYNVEQEFTDDQLIALFEKYSPRVDEPEIGNIVAHAMFNLVIRDHPQGLAYAQEYLETDISPLWQTAVHSLLHHHDLPDRVEGEIMEQKIEEGFDPNTPLGEFVLAGNVLWDFVERNASSTLLDEWHDPVRRSAYEDAVMALEQVYPPAANPYAKIIAILQETNGHLPASSAQRDELSQLSNEVDVLLSPRATVLRHLVRYPELRDEELGRTTPRSWQ